LGDPPVVLVTGASSGIGKACARQLAVGGSAEEMLIQEIQNQIETNLLGLMGVPFQSAYSATKHGIEGYSESLQMEVKAFGVRVVVIDPGDVRTEITRHRKESQGTGKDSPYQRSLSAAMRSQAESELRGWNVERIARLVERVVRSRRPRFRYTPGPFVERIAPVARRLIPVRLFLSILAAFYGVK